MDFLHLLVILLPWLTLLVQRPVSRRTALRSVAAQLILSCSLLVGGLALGCRSCDELTLWLLPFCSLVYLTLFLFIPRCERDPALNQMLLVSLGLDLIFFSVRSPIAMALLWPLTHLPLYWELGRHPAGRRLQRLFLVFLGPGCLLFCAGAIGLGSGLWAVVCVILGIALRKALFPVHQWYPALLEEAPLGPMLAFSCPQISAYAAVRLLTVHASDSMLITLGAVALFTSVYGACLALGNNSLRGVFASLMMGQTSLVFAGLQCTSQGGLSGGLAVWISGGLSLAGLGGCIWAMEARRGRIGLDRFHGGYLSAPVLAGSYLFLGLTCVGFPGTLGFISQEMLLDGTMHVHPHVGVLSALTACLNGITVMNSFFRVFCGSAQDYGPTQSIRARERMALLLLLTVLLGGGLLPQAFLASRSRISHEILDQRVSGKVVIQTPAVTSYP